MTLRKKLIEVAVPLRAVSEAAASEKNNPFVRNHPRSLHIWWARRPLAAARAVIFAQMVDDPSAWPDLFPNEKAQEKERQRLFRIIEDLVMWENTTNEEVLQTARNEIWESWRRACADNADHPAAGILFNRYSLPGFHDPFAGGGSLPVEAQRLGLEVSASDLNPVAVLINKALVEIPPKFAGKQAVNPEACLGQQSHNADWTHTRGLVEDIRYYGRWMSAEAERRIGHLYPPAEICQEATFDRPDLESLIGHRTPVIAWLWARTVRSPNPAFRHVDVPLVATFLLSGKAGREAHVEPVVEGDTYRFVVRSSQPKDPELVSNGTKLSRGNFRCLLSGVPITSDYIKAEGRSGRMGTRMIAIVAEGSRGRLYLSPTAEMEEVAGQAIPAWKPEGEIPSRLTGGTCVPYGLTEWADLFTPRQTVALTTFCDLVKEARSKIRHEALAAGMGDDERPLAEGGKGAAAYADAIATYLAIATSRWADISNSLCTWNQTNENIRNLFARQAIPMTWDYAELSPFSKTGPWLSAVESVAGALRTASPIAQGNAFQAAAQKACIDSSRIVSTDPPYYDNIAYADLSDFFYVWLRASLNTVLPDVFSTMLVPKAEELVATSYRHGSSSEAKAFFLEGMTCALRNLSRAHPAFPITLYYSFKQTDSKNGSTGWETFLDAVIRAGFTISGTWPLRTERLSRALALGTNSLASSILLVCRPTSEKASAATRREFVSALKADLPKHLAQLQRANIAPVDLAQAAIGPGMAIFSRYSSVLDVEGAPLSVGDALVLINSILDEILAVQASELDSESLWCLTWFEQYGFGDGEFGVAETLSKAKNTNIQRMAEAGLLASGRGKVRLLKVSDLDRNWDPSSGGSWTAWRITHQLILALDSAGEPAAAELLARIGYSAEVAKDLSYRLYSICERKKSTAEGYAYNSLVRSWPEITKLAQQIKVRPTQIGLFDQREG